MPPSRTLTAVERGSPPPRRKSCAGCTHAKRRCDLAQPACTRCKLRGRECRYPPPRRRAAGEGDDPDGASASASASASAQALLEPIELDIAALAENTTTTTTTTTTTSRSQQPPVGDSTWGGPDDLEFAAAGGAGVLDKCMAAATDWELLSSDLVVGPLALDLSLSWPMAPHETALDVAFRRHASSLRAAQVGAMAQGPARSYSARATMWGRLQYTLRQVLRAPRAMVLQNSTPWCHPRLYADAMPGAMQDAQACCALYMAKNSVNGPAVLRTIDAKIRALVAAPPPSTLLDALARVQALLLYEVMRMFDGDLRARRLAEENIPNLESAVAALFRHMPSTVRHPLPPASGGIIDSGSLAASSSSSSSSSDAHAAWTSWVLEESARRTAIMAFTLAALYDRLVREHMPHTCDQRLYYWTSWTVSAHLWTAADAAEFSRAWRQKNHFVSTNYDLADVLKEAGADDIDLYGRMMLSAMLGPERLTAWFASKGASL